MIGTRPPKESLELLLPGLLALLAVVVGVSMAVVLSAQARFVGNEGTLGTGLGSMSVGFGLVGASIPERHTRLFLWVLAAAIAAGFLLSLLI